MKIRQWKSGDNPVDDCGRMVLVNKKEAIQIIRSLSHQLEKLDADIDPNTVRAGFYPHDDEYGYFSIAVGEYDQVGDNDKLEEDKWCEDYIEDELINKEAREGLDDCLCDDCEEQFVDCDCGFTDDVHCKCICDHYYDCDEEYCLLCDQSTEDCACDDEDEFCGEFVVDTFKPMNVFVRARWLKAQKIT